MTLQETAFHWLKGETARVQCIRDNIHVSLLAKAYAAFVGASPGHGTDGGSTRAATRRARGPLPSVCATRAAARLGLPCRLEFGTQTGFPEPPVRINTDLLDAESLGWSETHAWDGLVEFYARLAFSED